MGQMLYSECLTDRDGLAQAICSVLRDCCELTLEFEQFPNELSWTTRLATLLNHITTLEHLSLSFGGCLHFQDWEKDIQLPTIIADDAYWSNLSRLRLVAVATSQSHLCTILSSHASTLRVLELAHIDIRRDRTGESWTSIILFLRHNLGLAEVHLGGNLSNSWDEAWCIHHPDEAEFRDRRRFNGTRPTHGTWLKHQVEQFVVKGGDFHLYPGMGIFDEASWLHWLSQIDKYDPRAHAAGDQSWYWCDGLLS